MLEGVVEYTRFDRGHFAIAVDAIDLIAFAQ